MNSNQLQLSTLEETQDVYDEVFRDCQMADANSHAGRRLQYWNNQLELAKAMYISGAIAN